MNVYNFLVNNAKNFYNSYVTENGIEKINSIIYEITLKHKVAYLFLYNYLSAKGSPFDKYIQSLVMQTSFLQLKYKEYIGILQDVIRNFTVMEYLMQF